MTDPRVNVPITGDRKSIPGFPGEAAPPGPASYDAAFFLDAGGETALERLYGATLDNAAVGTGNLILTYFTAKRSETIAQVRMRTGATAAAGATLCRIGIWTADAAGALLALVGSTPNDAALFAAANTAYTKALSAPWGKTAGVRYAAGCLVVTTVTAASIIGGGIVAGGASAVAPRLNGNSVGQADLPATLAVGAVQVTSRIYQFEFLP